MKNKDPLTCIKEERVMGLQKLHEKNTSALAPMNVVSESLKCNCESWQLCNDDLAGDGPEGGCVSPTEYVSNSKLLMDFEWLRIIDNLFCW